MSENKNILYSGMFLRPRVAESLRVLICNKVVQERAQFTVAKSQVHTNGLCEIVVKKQDPSVSTSSIMDLLKQCRNLVQENEYDSGRERNDLNKTIDLTSDDSICVASPTAISGRTVTMKGTTILSPFHRIEPELQNTALASNPLCISSAKDTKIESPFFSQSTDPSRKVSFKRNISADSLCEQPPLQSVPKRPTIVVQVSNNLHTSLASKSNDAKKSCGTIFYEDPLPGAPLWTSKSHTSLASKSDDPEQSSATKFSEGLMPGVPQWTSAGPSKFSLSNINKHLGAKDVGEDNRPSSSVSQKVLHDDIKDQPGITRLSRDASKTLHSFAPRTNSSGNEVVFSPSVSDVSLDRSIDQSVEILEESVEVSSSNSNNLCNEVESDQKNEKFKTKNESAGEKCKDVLELAQIKEASPGNSSTPHSDVRSENKGQCINEITLSDCLDNDIIIEKEVLSDSKTLSHALIIDDSDDDIAVCAVVSSTSSTNDSQLKKNLRLQLSKNQKKKKLKQSSSQVKVPAGTIFTASTSSGFAPDFIPLNPHYRRIDPKTSNCPVNTGKKTKHQKLHEKKMKKAKAQRTNKRGRDPMRIVDQSASTNQEGPSKERHEYNGNVINPYSGEPKSGLRPIVIDASNVAIGHGRGSFSVAGLKICIKYFTDRGHKVYTFAPKYRRSHVSPEARKAMDELEKEGVLSFTPSRTMPDGRKVASYDDRFIVQTAAELGGVVVSTDNFRDLLSENEAWRETIEKRLLMFTWAGDMLMFPNDPLGRDGPHLSDFLRFPGPPSQP